MNAEQIRAERRKTPLKEARFLLPIWGRRYVRDFLTCFLPTLLAPGNIPGVAREIPTRLIIMTSAESADRIKQAVSVKWLSDICRIEIRLIDDLIMTGNASTTITLAYEREVRRVGAAMRDTCFFFLVSDYFVADGSFLSVLRRIQNGASGVFAGNFQVVAEDALPKYRARRNHPQERPDQSKSGEPKLADLGAAVAVAVPLIEEPETDLEPTILTPRELIAFAVDHLHPATIANTVNLPATHNTNANRLFWRVDKETIIGRFYLMHMIGIRPELTDFEVGASCDYSFMPEMCPSGNIDIITDSDEYLVVEAQPRAHEGVFVTPGPQRPAALAASLAIWTTARHRANSATTLVYHAGDLPPGLDAAKVQAEAFVAETNGLLSLTPSAPHRGHPYWQQAVAFHRMYMGTRLTREDFEAIRPIPADDSRSRGVGARFRSFIIGARPAYRMWQPRFPDFAEFHKVLAAGIAAPSRRILVVTSDPRAYVEGTLDFLDRLAFASPNAFSELSPGVHSALVGRRFDLICAEVAESDMQTGASVRRMASLLAPGGQLICLVVNWRILGLEPFNVSMMKHMDQFQPLEVESTGAAFVVRSRWRRRIQNLMSLLARKGSRASWTVPLVVVGCLILLPFSAALNWRALAGARAGQGGRGRWSSVMFMFRAAGNADA